MGKPTDLPSLYDGIEPARRLQMAQEAFANAAAEMLTEVYDDGNVLVVPKYAYADAREALREWREAGDVFLRSLRHPAEDKQEG